MQSREDNRIPPEAASRAFAMVGAPVKEMVWLEGCGHVVTVDYGRERVFEQVAAWLDRHAAPAGSPRRTSFRRADAAGVAASGAELLERWTEPHRQYHASRHLVEMFWALEDLTDAG